MTVMVNEPVAHMAGASTLKKTKLNGLHVDEAGLA